MGFRRLLTIGDIHGCSTALHALLSEISLNSDDCVITLGDYIDRGPDSYEVIETLTQLYKQNQLIPLRGNHEMMLLDICRHGFQVWDEKNNQQEKIKAMEESNLELWLTFIDLAPKTAIWTSNGGDATIKCYRKANKDGMAVIPEHHYHFLSEVCQDWFEIEKYIFVHGGVLANQPLDSLCPSLKDFSPSLLHLKRTDPRTESRHCSGKIVVCGHDIQHTGVPAYGPNAICLDTGIYLGGWLSCLDLVTGDCWQANGQGVVRKLEHCPLPK